MSKQKNGNLWGYVLVAGVTAISTASLCLKPSRDFLLAMVKKAALLYGSSRRSVTSRLSGDWRGETADVYYGFNNGILYVTDQKGFENKDWKTGTYDLYRDTDDPAGAYTIVMRYDGQTTEYGLERLDDETAVFTRGGERFLFKSVRY
ncbi:MAG: hypothetical protein LBL37_05355 [Gracilibacteraceae bacterium]|jgi:hypothetical protein|nr:hypothetical protein [Gracilibacteraceae bacterium]